MLPAPEELAKIFQLMHIEISETSRSAHLKTRPAS